MKRFNLLADEWDMEGDRPGYSGRRASVAQRVGGERVGGSLYEVPPGEKTFPYHLHHANEEWLVVVRGPIVLRTPEGEHALRDGDTVCFPRGAGGAHQLHNRSDEAAHVLLLSTKVAPDVAEYPDSGKVGVLGPGLRYLFRASEQSDYWEGE